jgi:hypothetical protein
MGHSFMQDDADAPRQKQRLYKRCARCSRTSWNPHLLILQKAQHLLQLHDVRGVTVHKALQLHHARRLALLAGRGLGQQLLEFRLEQLHLCCQPSHRAANTDAATQGFGGGGTGEASLLE